MVFGMQNPEELQAFVETLGFQHLHLQLTTARVAILRDTVLDVFAFELGDNFEAEAQAGLSALLNYTGGAFIYVRTHYADRLRLLAESWASVSEGAGVNSKMRKKLDREGSGSSLGSGSEDGSDTEKNE